MILLINPRSTRPKNRRFPLSVMAVGAMLPEGTSWEIVDGNLPGIDVVGLMAMPPLASEPEESRRWFRSLAGLAASNGLPGLSMGTSADFEVAVEEGATAVRVGGVLAG